MTPSVAAARAVAALAEDQAKVRVSHIAKRQSIRVEFTAAISRRIGLRRPKRRLTRRSTRAGRDIWAEIPGSGAAQAIGPELGRGSGKQCRFGFLRTGDASAALLSTF